MQGVRQTDKSEQHVSEADVLALVGDKRPVHTEQHPDTGRFASQRLDIYEWNGLIKSRRLYIYYGHGHDHKQPDRDPLVVFVGTAPAEPQMPLKAPFTPSNLPRNPQAASPDTQRAQPDKSDGVTEE